MKLGTNIAFITKYEYIHIKGTMHQKYDVVLKYSNLNPIFASAIIFAKFPKYSPPAANRAKICLLFDLLF